MNGSCRSLIVLIHGTADREALGRRLTRDPVIDLQRVFGKVQAYSRGVAHVHRVGAGPGLGGQHECPQSTWRPGRGRARARH